MRDWLNKEQNEIELCHGCTINDFKLRTRPNISSERIRVQLMELPKHSVLGFCSHTDNVALIYTKNYSERPLVIQGGGAGVEVTATAVVSDILKLVSMTAHH